VNDLPIEQQAYELPEIWDLDWFPDGDFERVRLLAELIPPETRSLLDVGCGNGMFVNYLTDQCSGRFERLMGVDRSKTALAHVRTEKREASINALPFADREFDAVSCQEVIEHLPVPIYKTALTELARVAGQSILICVPYKQDLEADLSTCPHCRARINIDFHVRSFDEETMTHLLEPHGFKLTSLHHLGPHTARYDQEFRARLRKAFSKPEPEDFPSFAICPVCSFFDGEKLARDLAARKQANARLEARPVSVVAKSEGLRARLAAKMPTYTTYRWIAGTYVRNAG
jgi:SAM-dependent methyltransferase